LLLAVGSVASLAANVAVAEPTLTGRVIAAWPSFALIGAYELLMRQVRRTAAAGVGVQRAASPPPQRRRGPAIDSRGQVARTRPEPQRAVGQDVQWQAWQWALANRDADGSLPSGKAIAAQYGRHERWGRLVKRTGTVGGFGDTGGQSSYHLDGEMLPGLRPDDLAHDCRSRLMPRL
jgi:hypothetical protein